MADEPTLPDRVANRVVDAGLALPAPDPKPAKALPLLPGVVFISLYMLLLAGVLTLGVVGGHYSPLLLIAAALFTAASYGLLRLFRWAWAMSLAAVFLLMSYHMWLFAMQKQMPSGVQGGLNLVFFLYLVRVEVRQRLK